MNSSRPYLLRALYEWILDNDCTPHVLINCNHSAVRVPSGYAEDGQMVLNISPSATRYLEMGNEVVTCESRFGGVAHQLYVPIEAVMAIYARENGQGMVFELEAAEGIFEDGQDDDPEPTPPRPTGRPSLRVVK